MQTNKNIYQHTQDSSHTKVNITILLYNIKLLSLWWYINFLPAALQLEVVESFGTRTGRVLSKGADLQ